MLTRFIALGLFLFLAAALPLAASAGECQFVAVAFDAKKDIIEFISFDDNLGHSVAVLFYSNAGFFLRDSVLPSNLPSLGRVRVTATDVYNTWGANPPALADTYVKFRLGNSLTFPPFGVTVTNGGGTREIGCQHIPS